MTPSDLFLISEAARIVGVPSGLLSSRAHSGYIRVHARSKGRAMVSLSEVRAFLVMREESKKPRPEPTASREKDMTMEELDALVAEQMKSLPEWWPNEFDKIAGKNARDLATGED